jgi:uncharacterized integral membrane protein (TIGR00698 family)
VLALSVGNPFKKTGKVAKLLLQACVVMLGFTMFLPTVLKAGASGAIFAVATISTTLLLGWLVGKLLGTGRLTSLLISTGTAICGGSAIAAIGSVLDAPEGEMTVAMGTVFTLNAVALFIFPIIGHMLHMTQYQFGVWAGVAIHDVSSVVGAASSFDNALGAKAALAHGVTALQTATAVKLSRALWIVPLALAIAAIEHRKHRGPEHASQKRKIQIPWFIGMFILASLIVSYMPKSAALTSAENGISVIAKEGLKLTLFLIGAGLSMKTLRAVGWRALVQGVAVWAFISVASLLVIMHM